MKEAMKATKLKTKRETVEAGLKELILKAANEKDYSKAYRSFSLYRCFSLENQKKAAIDAANIYRNCRKKGFRIRKPNDCMIALISLTHQLELLHSNKDFDSVAKLYPLKIVKI